MIDEDYKINEEDDDRMVKIKEAMARLTPFEYKIWRSYVEKGTYAAVAREYRVSAPTARTYVQKIKNKIISQI